MKAILIDPKRREVRGIGVEYTTLSAAFFNGPNAKIALTMIECSGGLGLLVTNVHKRQGDGLFGLVGSGVAPVTGRALLIGYKRDGQGMRSTELTVRKVEELVRFIN